MKIDLHCHTKKTKSGDPITRNVSCDIFTEKIINADIKIVALTNHNHFDRKQFDLFSTATNGFCQIWPGVELDVINSENKRWHLIIISNPNKLSLFDKSVSELLCGKYPDQCCWNLNEIYSYLNQCDVLYIPHFHKKPEIPEEDIEELHATVGDRWRIFYEAPNYKSLSIFANHSINTLIGSDVKDWSTYEESTFADLRLPVESYEQFCLLSQRNEPLVNTLLSTKKIHKIEVSPHKEVKFQIQIYEDINIVFGQKGTGKSEILKSLKMKLVEKGLRCKDYFGSQKEDNFKEFLKTSDMKKDSHLVSAELCEDEFKKIMNWEDVNPTFFSNYVKWIDTRGNSKNKSNMKITDAVRENANNQDAFEKVEKDHSIVRKHFEKIEQINFDDYLSLENGSLLRQMLDKLAHEIRRKLLAETIDKYSLYLSNFSVDTIKLIADKKTDSLSKPSSTGYIEFVQKRLELLKACDIIVCNISDKEYREKQVLGELEDKGTIFTQKIYRMICDKSETAEFQKGIRILKKIKSNFEEVGARFYAHDIINIVDTIKDSCLNENIINTSSFLGLSKIIVTQDDQEYQPSSGEKGILLLQNVLRQDADAYILDEPEMGMGNSYIDSTIRPQIINLSKRQKIIVVATHNANIAVRTRPYQSIYRVHKNGQYMTYVGNPFIDKLKNIEDINDTKNWTEESMHTLEGGKEAFYERKVIYESGN